MNRAFLTLVLGSVAALTSAACSSPDSPGNPGGGGGGGNADCPVADDLIADFKTDNGIHPVDGRSGGFYVYGDTFGMFDPPAGAGAYPIDATTGNTACSGPGSFRVKASGFKEWGAATATDFVPKDGMYKGTYNASKYKGVAFWIKASAALKGVQVGFPDVYTAAEANPTAIDPTIFPCRYLAGATNNCSPYLVKFGDPDFPDYAALNIGTSWQHVYVLFKDTKQDKGNMGYHRPSADYVDLEHLCSMAVQVNANHSTMPTSANDFELWLDDVTFIKK